MNFLRKAAAFFAIIVETKGKIMKMSILAATAAALVLTGCSSAPKSKYLGIMYSATSPDGKNEIRLYSNPLAYEVLRDGVLVVHRTEIGL